jgi:hypothetical protein
MPENCPYLPLIVQVVCRFFLFLIFILQIEIFGLVGALSSSIPIMLSHSVDYA